MSRVLRASTGALRASAQRDMALRDDALHDDGEEAFPG
jgi:hypothetical protein